MKREARSPKGSNFNVYTFRIYLPWSDDSCITEAEYFAVSKLPPEVSDPIYKWLDENHDGCWKVDEINLKYRSMDKNGILSFLCPTFYFAVESLFIHKVGINSNECLKLMCM